MGMGVVEVLAEAGIQGVNVDVLDCGRRIMGALAAAAASLAQAKPVGCPITAPSKALPIHEGFQ